MKECRRCQRIIGSTTSHGCATRPSDPCGCSTTRICCPRQNCGAAPGSTRSARGACPPGAPAAGARFTLSAIRELLATWENGRDLAGVLGLEQELTLPWHQEPAGRTTRAGLDERLGSPITSQQLADLEAIGVIHPDEEPDAGGVLHYTVPSPNPITAGVEMVKVGIPLDAVNKPSAQLRADMYAAATGLTESVGEHLISDTPDNLPEAENVPDLIESLERLRRISSTSVAAWFGIVMDQAIADYIGNWVNPKP